MRPTGPRHAFQLNWAEEVQLRDDEKLTLWPDNRHILVRSRLNMTRSENVLINLTTTAATTHPPWTPLRSHRSATQTVSRNSCRSRSCPTWSQTACLPATCDTCCTRSRPHASAYLCRKGPANGLRLAPSLCVILQRINSSYLGVDSNDLIALLAVVGKHLLVALDTVGVVIAQHVPLSGQGVVAMPAAEVVVVPILGHCLRVFAAEN